MTQTTLPMATITVLAISIAAPLNVTVAQSTPAANDVPKVPFKYNWPDGPGKDVVEKACLSCHNASVIVAPPRRKEEEWANEVGKMIGRGAILSDDDADKVIEYLATHFAPNSKNLPPVASQSTEKSSESNKTVPPTVDGTSGSANTADPSIPVNVNKASAQDIERALGLSKAAAESIIQHRRRFGKFKNWQGVAAVQGVPPEKIEENQKRLVF